MVYAHTYIHKRTYIHKSSLSLSLSLSVSYIHKTKATTNLEKRQKEKSGASMAYEKIHAHVHTHTQTTRTHTHRQPQTSKRGKRKSMAQVWHTGNGSRAHFRASHFPAKRSNPGFTLLGKKELSGLRSLRERRPGYTHTYIQSGPFDKIHTYINI
jgi:hypothetical protein